VTGVVGRPALVREYVSQRDNEIPFTVLSTLYDAAFYSGFLFGCSVEFFSEEEICAQEITTKLLFQI